MRRNRIESRLGYHVWLKPRDRGVIATTPEARRILARAVHESCGDAGLLSFGLADNHVHLVLACCYARASRAAKRLALMLGWRLEISGGFERPGFERIADGAHLRNAFRYTLRQALGHRLDPGADPFFESTSLPDLLGLRLPLAPIIDNVRTWLPRLCAADALDMLDLDGRAIIEDLRARASSRTLVESSVDELVDVGLSAALLPSLEGFSTRAMALRRAIIELAEPWLRPAALSRLVGLAPSTLRRVRKGPVDQGLLRAMRRQLAFRQCRREICGHATNVARETL